jgi:hypothetical protein
MPSDPFSRSRGNALKPCEVATRPDPGDRRRKPPGESLIAHMFAGYIQWLVARLEQVRADELGSRQLLRAGGACRSLPPHARHRRRLFMALNYGDTETTIDFGLFRSVTSDDPRLKEIRA